MTSNIPVEEQCVYCNGVPTNHRFHYISTTGELFISDFFGFVRFPDRLPKFLERFAVGILQFLGWTLTKLRIISYTENIELGLGERTRSVLREAKKRGIPVQIMQVFGKPLEVCRAYFKSSHQKRASWHYFDSLPIPSWSEGVHWVDDKKRFNKKFTRAGLPVAQSKVVLTFRGARNAFRTIGAPVIVKPRSGSRARHTTVNIKDETDLKHAYDTAKMLCAYLLVESYIPGHVYRATCIGKKVVGIIKFVKPSVIADGTMSVSEMLVHANANKKYPHLKDVRDNAWFRDSIAHQGFTPESVPPAGTEIFLTEHSERYNGGYFIDVTDDVPKENIELIECGARLTKCDVIGFDIISRDLTKPLNEEPLHFIEGNTLPFIEIHLTPYDGLVRDTPKALWNLWF